MPDSLNRFYLSELEDRVFRELRLVQATVNTSTGAESAPVYQSQAISTTDIDRAINRALVKLYNKIIADREEQFSQTYYVTVQNGNVGPYSFPPNMLILRFMDWIDPGIGQTNALPEQWVPMQYIDDPMDRQIAQNFRGPTWAYDNSGTGFVLNWQPTQDNPSGVRIKAVVLPPPLKNATDVIQARFAAVLQEVVIFEAAQNVAPPSTNPTLLSELAENREEWWQTLVTTADNAHKPPSQSMISSRLPQMTYSGRRHRRGGW